MANDNWGHQARFGVFIVGAEPVPEAEWWAMVPPGVSIHAARLTSKTPWATWNADRSEVDLGEDLEHGAHQFAAMAADVVVVGHSSSSVLGGTGWDDAVVRRLEEVIGGKTKVTTNGQDCALAVATVGASRPFVIIPPWFGDGFIETARNYLVAQGLNPASMFRHIPEDRWRDVPPGDLYRSFMHLEQNAELLRDQVIANCPDDADSVLMIGTGLRCVGVIDEVEAALGRPVTTANQASLWRCLRMAGVSAPVQGYGRLLSG
ncbi:MAG: hypothetical protein P8Q48_01375 [Paracoccaceae bacterium]|nr:hypothetical protein [Paracoccaceae bacterium]MDG1368899.1 hypothetical protein [Paracoccaceae bacterium]